MLKGLTVENYALISSLEMELSPGLNIITGETGAGKSILLGALGMLLGNRTEVSSLGDRKRNCVVEGIFDISGYGMEGFFEENDLDFDVNTVIRRVITPSGKSRAYVNDLPVQVGVLKELGESLIDIHSQHQSLMIGNELFRLGILDSVAGNSCITIKYKEAYERFENCRKRMAELREEAELNSRDEDYLRFQADELCNANLREGEQDELEELMGRLSHAEEIRETLAYVGMMLGEDETGVLSRLKSIETSLDKIHNVYTKGNEFISSVRSTLIELRELEREMESECEATDSDPAALERTRDRLDRLYSLQHKHRAQDMAELIAKRDEYVCKLEAINSSAEDIDNAARQLAKAESEALELAVQITSSRKIAAEGLKKDTESILRELGIPNATFEVIFTEAGGLGKSGADHVQFLFSANSGSVLMPAEKTASGGEISRLMLALKSIAAVKSKLPTIIFDEIDAGVSGRIADCMGEIINRMGGHMQIVNITHLPQVASKGETHFLVYKDDSDSHTRTLIKKLMPEERTAEIAKMLSGSEVSEAAMAQASLLLGRQKNHFL